MKPTILAFLLALTAPTLAQPALTPPPNPDKPDPARLQAFSGTPFYQGLVSRALASVPPATGQRCPARVSKGSQLTILKPVRYADDGFPVMGTWKQAFPVSGCGPDTTLNFYFIATTDHLINTVIGLPGSTRADPTLQHEAQDRLIAAATAAAQQQGRACADYAVRNTRFRTYGLQDPPTPDPGPAQLRRPWWESWTVAGCGQTLDIPVDFIPHAGLTEIVQPGHITESNSAHQATP